MIYLQTECIEKYQFYLCSKCDREHDLDVILRQVVSCRKLRWICRKRSNDVAREVKTPGKDIARQVKTPGKDIARQVKAPGKDVARHDFLVAWSLRYTMTVKFIDTATKTFSV